MFFVEYIDKLMITRHTDIRTYTFAESSINPGGFALKSLEDVYTAEFWESERPHRHAYYAIMFIEKAQAFIMWISTNMVFLHPSRKMIKKCLFTSIF